MIDVNAKATSRPRGPSASRPILAQLGALCLTLTSVTASAQVIPAQAAPQIDPGALQRNQEDRQRFLQQAPTVAPTPPAVVDEQNAPVVPPPLAGPHFVLRALKFDSSEFLSAEELNAIAAPFIGQDMDYKKLLAVVALVNQRYFQKNILTAHAELAPQRVKDGVVNIRLLEAKLGAIEVRGQHELDPVWVNSWFPNAVGATLDTAALEGHVELFNHTNLAQIEARLRPGSEAGQTDVLLDVQEPPLIPLRLFANNEGAKSVGAFQFGFETGVQGMLGRDDRLRLSVTRSRGSTPITLAYNVPFNTLGGRAELSHSTIHIHVVDGPYTSLDVEGNSPSTRFTLSQPLWRTESWWFDGNVAVGKGSSSNTASGATLNDTATRNYAVEVNAVGVLPTRTLTAGINVNTLQFTALKEDRKQATVALVSGSWLEKYAHEGYTVVRGSLQSTSSPVLESAALFQIGGVGTVRGYDVGAASGVTGYFLNTEYHYPVSENFTPMVFFDNGAAQTRGVKRQEARSIGLGVDSQWSKGVTANITAGHPLTTLTADQSRWLVTARISWNLF